MTNEERKVMKQALEALEKSRPIDQSSTIPHNKHVSAITAIREALAQEQEPVAWLHNGKLHEFDPSDWATGPVTPLYTSPQVKPWVGLTDEEIDALAMDDDGLPNSHLEFAWAIEAKLKEKNQ